MRHVQTSQTDRAGQKDSQQTCVQLSLLGSETLSGGKAAGTPDTDSGGGSGIGESLPLFADNTSTNRRGDAASAAVHEIHKDADAPVASQLTEAERHMQAAWRLSNALRGRSAGAAKVRRLKPQQKHQLGSIICGHLLASLRAQADLERRQQAH